MTNTDNHYSLGFFEHARLARATPVVSEQSEADKSRILNYREFISSGNTGSYYAYLAEHFDKAVALAESNKSLVSRENQPDVSSLVS